MATLISHVSSTANSVSVQAYHNESRGSRIYWDYRVPGGAWLNRGYDVVSSGVWRGYTFTGLTPNTTYEFRARTVDGSQSSLPVLSQATLTASTQANRPTNFEWEIGKYSGYAFNIRASEWRTLCTKINEFRVYKNQSLYSFSAASSGNQYTASHYNEARNAISSMAPNTSIPPFRNRGDIIYASDINRLRDSLNSVT